MSLIITPEAVHVPGYCSASGSTTGPFIDTGYTVGAFQPRTQLSIPWLHSIAAEIGLVPAPELAQALTDLAAALTETDALRQRVERFDEDVANVTEAMDAFIRQVRDATGDVPGASE